MNGQRRRVRAEINMETKEESRTPTSAGKSSMDTAQQGIFSIMTQAGSTPGDQQSRMVAKALVDSLLAEQLFEDNDSSDAESAKPSVPSSQSSSLDGVVTSSSNLDSTVEDTPACSRVDPHEEEDDEIESVEPSQLGSAPVRTRWTEPAPEEMIEFSVSDVKRMVLDSLPEEVRQNVPMEAWDRIFNETDSVLTEMDDMVSVKKGAGQEDVSDIVSFISDRIQQHVIVTTGRSSNVSVMSELSSATTPKRRASSALQKSRVASQFAASPYLRSSLMLQADGTPRALPLTIISVSSSENTRVGPRIRFGNVDIRYYERILCDNPAVTAGPPIGLGWKFKELKYEMTVKDFEFRRIDDRRSTQDLILPRHTRCSMLMEVGYSQGQIADNIRSIMRAKSQRSQTYHNLKYQAMEEFMEKTGRRFKKALTLGWAGKSKKIPRSNNNFTSKQRVRVRAA